MLHYRIHKRMFYVYLIVLITFLVIILRVFYLQVFKVNNIKEEADKQNMYATSSLMDEYIEGYMKKLWMCRQRDKGDRS